MMATARDKTVEQLLGSLSGVAFTIANRGYADIPAASANGPNFCGREKYLPAGVNGFWDIIERSNLL